MGRRDWVVVVVCAAVLGGAAAYDLALPGVQYDECLNAAPAVNFVTGRANTRPMQINSSVVEVLGRPFPLMVMTYVGPVKGLLYIPLFWAGGISTTTLRLLPWLAVVLTLPLLYALCLQLFDRRVAALAVVLLALDPALVFYLTRDVGPAALQVLFKLVALLFLARWWRDPRTGWLAAGMLVLGIAVSHKVDFLWVVAGLGVAAAAVAGSGVWARLRWKGTAVGMLAFAAGALPVLLLNVLAGGATFAPLFARLSSGDIGTRFVAALATRLTQTVTLLNGDLLSRLYAEEGIRTGPLAAAMPLAVALSPLALLLVRRAGPARARPLAGLWIFTVVVLVASCFSPYDLKGHHLLALYPALHVAVAVLLTAVSERMGGAWMLAPAVCVLLAANAAAVVSIYSVLQRTGGTRSWSDSIYAVNEYLVERGQPVVALDWGFTLNLMVLSAGELRIGRAYEEFWKKPVSAATLYRFIDRGTLYLAHPPGSEVFPGAFDAFVEAAGRRALTVRENAVFRTRDGRRVSTVYSVSAAEAR